MLALKSSIKMCSSVACFLTLCLAGFPWSTKHRGEARSRAVWSNKCKSPMNHWVLQSLICSLCAFWKQCTEHNAKLPKDTMIIIVLCCHHVPHTQAHPKVKGNLHSEVLLSSFVKDPSCPLLFKNVPQGMKTSAKTCVGLIVHPCIERERLSWDTRRRSSLTAHKITRRQKKWKEKPGPDTAQTSLSISTGFWRKGLQTEMLKPSLKMMDHHCSSAQQQNLPFTHSFPKGRNPGCS